MPRNVEIKARVDDPAAVASMATGLAGSGPEVIRQHDTFYAARRGRLKLRRLEGGRGELIAYDRPDGTGPRTSDYHLYRTERHEELGGVLAAGLTAIGDVRKTRRLWHVGRTRVHLDAVEGLGDFLELEVVLAAGEGVEAGRREAEELMDRLGIDKSRLISGAYVDLLGEAEKT
ncbi:CYTH domain-containing protein [bacterium]|nr:CYTH domain-containing protein [bacterium]